MKFLKIALSASLAVTSTAAFSWNSFDNSNGYGNAYGNGYGYGDGYGQGRGDAAGAADGEMDFSMTFKGRGRGNGNMRGDGYGQTRQHRNVYGAFDGRGYSYSNPYYYGPYGYGAPVAPQAPAAK